MTTPNDDAARARALVAGCLKTPEAELPEEASRETWPDWDSFAHLNVMLALEEAFGVPLTDETVARYSSLSAIAALIGARRVRAATDPGSAPGV